MSGRWEHYPHDADIGVRGVGGTKAEAFEQGALALTALVTRPESITPWVAVPIACEATDDELLFAAWLNAVIYEMAVRGMLFGRYAVRIDERRLSGTAWGEAADARRHRPAVEIKGATYTTLCVQERADGEWVAQTVVDV